jgi:hypothetical protein
VHVDGAGCDRGEVAALPRLLFDLCDLLPLLAGWCDLCAQDDVTDLTLCECVGVDVVLLGIVGQDEVLERNLNLCVCVCGGGGVGWGCGVVGRGETALRSDDGVQRVTLLLLALALTWLYTHSDPQ